MASSGMRVRRSVFEAFAKARSIPARDGFEIVQGRRRLGLTQEQLAAALNVTIQTLRIWEAGQGTKHMSRKTRDLREVLSRMDDYVVAPKEKAWLSAPLEAFGGRSPQELIKEGRIREMVVEFDRLGANSNES